MKNFNNNENESSTTTTKTSAQHFSIGTMRHTHTVAYIYFSSFFSILHGFVSINREFFLLFFEKEIMSVVDWFLFSPVIWMFFFFSFQNGFLVGKWTVNRPTQIKWKNIKTRKKKIKWFRSLEKLWCEKIASSHLVFRSLAKILKNAHYLISVRLIGLIVLYKVFQSKDNKIGVFFFISEKY